LGAVQQLFKLQLCMLFVVQLILQPEQKQ
jgi:hypothetical protein